MVPKVPPKGVNGNWGPDAESYPLVRGKRSVRPHQGNGQLCREDTRNEGRAATHRPGGRHVTKWQAVRGRVWFESDATQAVRLMAEARVVLPSSKAKSAACLFRQVLREGGGESDNGIGHTCVVVCQAGNVVSSCKNGGGVEREDKTNEVSHKYRIPNYSSQVIRPEAGNLQPGGSMRPFRLFYQALRTLTGDMP